MNIHLDFDGVIVNSHIVKVEIARQKYGVNIPPEQYRRSLVAGKQLTEEQYREIGREAMNGSHPLPLVKDALFYLYLLMEDGHNLKIVTSRTEQMLEAARGILQSNGLGHLMIEGIGYGLSKREACQGADVYVDDDLEKLEPIIGAVPHLYLFTWPWNLHEVVPKGIESVKSWYSLYQEIFYELEVRA